MYYSGSWGQSWSSLSIKREISVCLFFTYLENCASDLLPAGRMLQTRWSAMSVCEVVWMSSHSATAAHLWSKVGLHQYCSLLMTWQCILILRDQTVTLLCGSNTWGRAISPFQTGMFRTGTKKISNQSGLNSKYVLVWKWSLMNHASLFSYFQIHWIHRGSPSCLETSSGPLWSVLMCTRARRSPSVCRHQQGGCSPHSSPRCDQNGTRCPCQSYTPTVRGRGATLQPVTTKPHFIFKKIEFEKYSQTHTHTHTHTHTDTQASFIFSFPK